jgi:hypothetical protein
VRTGEGGLPDEHILFSNLFSVTLVASQVGRVDEPGPNEVIKHGSLMLKTLHCKVFCAFDQVHV